MSQPQHPDVVFSAPGKALVAGGYLVLFQEYTALSVALSSRIYAAARFAEPGQTNELVVINPQFVSEWRYPSREGTHTNPYLNACYDVVSAYFDKPVSGKLNIWSDNGFHSQTESQTGVFGALPFSSHGKPITEVPKTGLGSSAALVASIVAAMVALSTKNANVDVNLVHNLAQTAHCIAQGKVGSGFDVATAVFGSILYSRFSPKCILPSTEDHSAVKHAIDAVWDMKTSSVLLPSSVSVLMGDVQQGSETPGMVRQVLKWKEENPDQSLALFSALNNANQSLAASLAAKASVNSAEVSKCIAEVRKNLQKLTALSNVPIEPSEQTKLLDTASAVPGVLGGVVPGAGGHDAVCVLVNTESRALPDVLTDLNKIEGVEWMQLQVEAAGLRSEECARFPWFEKCV